MPTLIYSTAEFRAMHGGVSIVDSATRCELFPDGARIDSLGRHDPPTDPSQLLRAKRLYVALKLAREENDFNTFHHDCATQLSHRQQYGNTVPPPPADWKQQLERGKGRIEKLRNELAALDREIAAFPDEQARRAYYEQRRQQSGDAGQALTELMGLKID